MSTCKQLLMDLAALAKARQIWNPLHDSAPDWHPAPSSQRGFTLVELMIAMVLSLFLLGAITYVVVNSNKNYNTTDSLSRLQENARFAMEFITRDLRRSAHAGCANNMAKINNGLINSTYGGKDTHDIWIIPLDGVENVGTAASWSATGQSYTSGFMALIPSSVTNQALVPTSDALAIRYINNEDAPAVAVTMDNETADVIVNDNGKVTFKAGDIVVVTNCAGGDIFQVTGVATNGSQIALSHQAGAAGFKPGNEQDGLKRTYGANPPDSEQRSMVSKTSMIAYYIATNNTTGQRALYRDTPTDGNKEIVEGVESLQVQYGVANSVSGSNPNPPRPVPVSYLKADQINSGLTNPPRWKDVISVRFGILVSSIANTADGQYGTEKDSGTYTVNGEIVSPSVANERRLRRVFENTVMLRNPQ